MITLLRFFPLLSIALLLYGCSQRSTNTVQNNESKSNKEIGKDEDKRRPILFFGNSLTAGYGLESQDEAFPAIIQHKIDSLGLNYQCINAGLSGETSAGGKDRIDWLLEQPVDIFVLELGANDGLRGISTESTYNNLSAIVQKVVKAYPKCKLVLAGMKIPPSMGQEYSNGFEAIFPKLATDHKMALIPFLLDGIAGEATLNQQDRIHPTAEGQKIMAETVWSILMPLL